MTTRSVRIPDELDARLTAMAAEEHHGADRLAAGVLPADGRIVRVQVPVAPPHQDEQHAAQLQARGRQVVLVGQ
jgi:hypothetical protein